MGGLHIGLAQILVIFAEKKPKKTWFSMGEVRPSYTASRETHFYTYANRKKSHGRNGSPFLTKLESLTLIVTPRIINAEVRQPQTDKAAFNVNLSKVLHDTLLTILNHTSSEAGRSAVPPITNSSGISPFPFRISVKVAGTEVG